MQPRQRFSFWMFILSALVLVIFSVQNAHEVAFNYFVWKNHLSLSVLLIVAFLVGLIVGAFFAFRSRSTSKTKKADEKVKEVPAPKTTGTTDPEETQWPL
jgi:uncharacterized integral membrane protein